MGNRVKVFILTMSVLIGQISDISCQTHNLKTIISSFLRECYSEQHLLNRNNLPPMTLPVFLDIVRKVEDSTIGDMRQISTALVHLFRQDGIVYDPTATGTQNIVPFSPTGFQAYKNRLLVNKLLPLNLFNVPTEFLVSEDKCALHHMMSSSVALQNRGDEEWTCSRIMTAQNTNVRLSQFRKNQDIELFDVKRSLGMLGQQVMGISNCPIETGVVSTPWGDVSMGTVVTGISAGLEEQKVLVTDLVTVRPGFDNNTIVVNNRYAATISGDIAEAAIRQGISRNAITVGASGGWNSTSARRHYFVTQNENLELTDAEIRAGLDGLVLSELGNAYVNRFPEFKTSQLIDMYYSHNGILHEARFRACNRKVLVPDIASTQMLMEESLGPAVALYHMSSLSGSTNLRGVQYFINQTIEAFNRYIPPNINDPVCQLTNNQVMRPRVNLILITEPTFARAPLISHIVDEIEVGKFGSSVTLLDSATGEIVVDKTFSIATFYEEFAKRTVAQTGTLNMLNILQSLVTMVPAGLEREMYQHYSGGNSSVVLFLSDTIPLAGSERVQAVHRANWLTTKAPDLRLVFATSSASEAAVAPMLKNLDDFIPVSLVSMNASFAELRPVIDSLIQTPRRIINPECGSEWRDINSGIVGFDGFVDADGINLYRMMPNYFYGNSITRLLRIQSSEHGSITVCYSRTNVFPRRNRTTSVVPGDTNCEFAVNGEIVEISLAGACEGFYSISSCPPLYLTVAATLIPGEPQCREFGCRFPNDIKYLVAAHDLGCYNQAGLITAADKIIIYICIILIMVYNTNNIITYN